MITVEKSEDILIPVDVTIEFKGQKRYYHRNSRGQWRMKSSLAENSESYSPNHSDSAFVLNALAEEKLSV